MPTCGFPRRFDSDDRHNRKAHMLRVVGRRRPGVSLDEARADMTTIAARLSEDHPEWMTGWSVNVVSLHEDLVRQERTRLLVLLGAVALVLLIAYVNVANLLLARASSRERETAIRVAMGAGRHQLLKQFLVESTLLALVGGALGMSLTFYESVSGVVSSSPRWHCRSFFSQEPGSCSTVSGVFSKSTQGSIPGVRSPCRFTFHHRDTQTSSSRSSSTAS
ncbi:MAG: FtsX-like permease family protein [Acidobacteria bacterium]|nr:MAG: FtsX-like permease family protein [Acidobacteriota bacterium]